MTPLVSKKMDQFLGESGGCLCIIMIHAAEKIKPCLSIASGMLYTDAVARSCSLVVSYPMGSLPATMLGLALHLWI